MKDSPPGPGQDFFVRQGHIISSISSISITSITSIIISINSNSSCTIISIISAITIAVKDFFSMQGYDNDGRFDWPRPELTHAAGPRLGGGYDCIIYRYIL